MENISLPDVSFKSEQSKSNVFSVFYNSASQFTDAKFTDNELNSILEDEETNESIPDENDVLTEQDYSSLFTIINKLLENGNVEEYMPPLIKSQFEFVPPTINFIPSNKKCSITFL